MQSKKWNLLPIPLDTQELEQALTISKPLAKLLKQRNVHTFNDAKRFFRPRLEDLHDPFLMKDMDKAVTRLLVAMERNETILIYGDYDVDGTTAVALVSGFLSEFYNRLLYYNPDRYKEGYGISKTGIDYAKEEGVSLVIALDCGIKAKDQIDYASTLGMDFIICDHHEPGAEIPSAAAVLDPKRKDCPYPYKELTGNGVGFKLLMAFCIKKEIGLIRLYEYLDLAMVSIASDIVPITGENRILAYFGLKKMNENPRTSLRALKEVAGFTGEMTIENVVFTLGPRINAAGRIKHAKAAVQLLLSTNYDEAVSFAHDIQAHNLERKQHDARITEEALSLIHQNQWLLHEARSTVLYKEDWHKGVIGIVASRCIEHYYRPTIIFTQTKEGFAAGSARSVVGFNLYEAIESCSHLLEQFGGHMHAAGMTIALENLPLFQTAFDQKVREAMGNTPLIPEIDIDIELNFEDINGKFYRIMRQMGPFGPKNMQPVFWTSHLKLASEPRIMKEKHFKLELVDPRTGICFNALGFNMVDFYLAKIKAAESIDIAYTIEENTFRGSSSLELFLKDIKC